MLKPGDSFERYTIEALLGQGGMGAVYRAHDPRLDRYVALKVLAEAGADAGTEAKARLLREARAAAALDHPHAVAIYDVGEAAASAGEEPQPYIVMELVNGDTLRTFVGDASIPWQKRLGWMLDAARALGAAHKRGLVHRDIKPENVMVRRDGVVKVLDFGIARRSTLEVDPTAPTQGPALPTLTERGVQVGTPLYMAPEQIKGDPMDGKTDQFSWAVSTYELLSGRPPWRSQGGALGVVAAVLTEEPPSLRASVLDLPAGVEAAIQKALSKRAADRFRSMEDMTAEIQRHLDADPGVEAPVRGGGPSASGAPGPATDLRRYSTGEMREVLQRALERQQERPTGFTREELVEAAREVGVDEEAIAGALREAEIRRAGPIELAERRRRALRGFLRHLASYVVVNVFLGFLSGHLVRGLAFGWGIAVALHLVNVLFPKDPKEEEEEERKKEAKKARKKRRSAPAPEPAPAPAATPPVEAGVTALLEATTARARRLRIQDAGGQVADPRTDEALREAQAEAEAERGRARARR